MKKLSMPQQKGIALGILLILSLQVLPQSAKPKNLVMADFKRFHFGYSVGLNTAGFTIVPNKDYRMDLVRNPGININLITDYRLGKYLNVRLLPGIQFAERDLSVTNIITGETKTPSWKIESIFMDMPILLKYRSSRVNNYAPYLIAGINPRIDLLGADIPPETVKKKLATRILNPFDIYAEVGVGVDFYLSMVKVAAELKFSVGMLDIFHNPGDSRFDLYVAGVNQVYSRMVILAFHVEQSR
jgi:hypothetical protein